MNLVEVHNIKATNKYYAELDKLCFLSKNLYNSTLYYVRQKYFDKQIYVNYYEVNKVFVAENQVDYRALPAKVAKLVQKQVDHDFKTFFALLRKKSNGKYNKSVHIPKYAHKKKGRKMLHYERGALSFQKEGYIKLSKTNVYIKTQLDKSEVRYVEVVPRNGYIKILVGYEKGCKPLRINQRYASIDLGVDNLAVVSSNVMKPFIVNGRPLKSINQYANKQIAYYQGLLEEKKYTSKRIDGIRLKRENKINDYMHKASTYIVNQLVSNEISLLVIGYNQEWKQDTKMGKRCNQNFVGIPFYKFVQMLKYKCELAGIKVEIQEESYTSKCSFLDKEEICRHKSYQGARVHRGLYRSKGGVILNADLNGSMNILRKYLVSKDVAWESIWRDQVEVSSEPRLYCVSM